MKIERIEDTISSAGKTRARVTYTAGLNQPRALAYAEQLEQDPNLWTAFRWSSKFGPVILRSAISQQEAEAEARAHCEANAGRKQGPIGRAVIGRPHPRMAREHQST